MLKTRNAYIWTVLALAVILVMIYGGVQYYQEVSIIWREYPKK